LRKEHEQETRFMSDEILVKVEGVSKKFCKSLKHSILYGISDIVGDVFDNGPSRNDTLRMHEFWAVDDVSFEIRRGECLGLIGRNGAGKSTLLKMLSGIILPDKGIIEVHGRVAALIELGAGFHPMLTGRENIYINGSILGLTKKEIDAKFESIVDFAELEAFIDTPVKFYSSGMQVRLGFAVAAHLNPDVLLIDEVLAVGDIGFRAKCFNLIAKISKNAAVIFVSHQMPQVARVCTDICFMNAGNAIYQGKNVPKGIEQYYTQLEHRGSIVAGNGRAIIHKIELESNVQKPAETIKYLDDLCIRLDLSVDVKISNPVVTIGFFNQELQLVAQCNSSFNNAKIANQGRILHIKVKFPKMTLNPGDYLLSVGVHDETLVEVLIQHYGIKRLKISGEFVGLAPVQLVGNWKIEHGENNRATA